MPIKGNIKDSSFAPQIRLFDNVNGSKKLKACINEYIKAVFEIEVYWYAEPKLFDIFDNVLSHFSACSTRTFGFLHKYT